MKITLIAGARPNFMKIAPIIKAIQSKQKDHPALQYRLVHTGQHYDQKMSESFFEDLEIPKPDVNLECGGGTQAEQTGAIMVAFEQELKNNPADLVMVVGDVTSTLACSIVAKKLNTKVAHVEAGIRSGDMTMPEEINRIVTDSITDYFFTTSHTANQNLLNRGVREDQICFAGNVMIDTLMANQPKFKKPEIWDNAVLKPDGYLVMTLHRPGNVDEEAKFKRFIEAIVKAAGKLPIIFPVHPRTARIIQSMEMNLPAHFHLIDPLGYHEFNYLVQNARAVLTDSGGITEEATVMNVPCMTLRDNTERPETVEIGTNELIGTNPDNIEPAFDKLLKGAWKKGRIPEKWDGKAADRIVEALLSKAQINSV